MLCSRTSLLFVVLLLAPSCSGDSARDDDAPGEEDALHIFIGDLHLNQPRDHGRPSEYCLEDGLLWRGAAHRMSTYNVLGLETRIYNERHPIGPTLPRAAPGEVTVVRGVIEEDFGKMVRDVGPCDAAYLRQAVPQLEGAPVASEGGFQTTHAALQAQGWIRAEDVVITRFHEIVEQDDTRVTIRFQNPLDVPLGEFEAELRYDDDEHAPIFEPYRIPAIAAKGSATIELTHTLEHVGVTYTLRTIIIRGTRGTVHLDVRLPIHIAPEAEP